VFGFFGKEEIRMDVIRDGIYYIQSFSVLGMLDEYILTHILVGGIARKCE